MKIINVPSQQTSYHFTTAPIPCDPGSHNVRLGH